LLKCSAFAFLTEFGTLSVSSHALALLAITALITIVRTFAEQLGHFMCVKVSISNFATKLKVCPERFILKQ